MLIEIYKEKVHFICSSKLLFFSTNHLLIPGTMTSHRTLPGRLLYRLGDIW